jgi:hypothetical protein
MDFLNHILKTAPEIVLFVSLFLGHLLGRDQRSHGQHDARPRFHRNLCDLQCAARRLGTSDCRIDPLKT